MPDPISVRTALRGRTEELGRLLSLAAALPLGGTTHGHPGAESQADLVLLHTLGRKFPAPSGKCLVPFTACAPRVPSSPYAFQHICCPFPSAACLFLLLGNDTAFLSCVVLNTGCVWAAAVHALIYLLLCCR